MRLITAVIKPFKLDDVKEALKAAGVTGITVTQVSGFGRQAGHTEVYRGAEYNVDFLPKIKVEILCDDADADALIGTVADACRTGKIGDGKIWSIDIASVMRARTGEQGTDAI
jgi:nitrogen regulatory protein P-II 1